eukprot:gene20384-22393_t
MGVISKYGRGYYAPVIFLGALMIILSFLVFLHWLAQFWLDSQERNDADDILDSDEDDFASSYGQFVEIEKNKVRKKQFHKRRLDNARASIPKIEVSSVSEKSVKIFSKNRLAVSMSIKHSFRDLKLTGLIKGITGLKLSDKDAPNKIRFKLRLHPKPVTGKQTFKTGLYFPLESELKIPFRFKLIRKSDLASMSLHLRLFAKKETLGLPIGPENCYGEAFISLADLANEGINDEINIVQEVIPLGSKPFVRKTIRIRVADPQITTKEFPTQQLQISRSEFDSVVSSSVDTAKEESVSLMSVNDVVDGTKEVEGKEVEEEEIKEADEVNNEEEVEKILEDN